MEKALEGFGDQHREQVEKLFSALYVSLSLPWKGQWLRHTEQSSDVILVLSLQLKKKKTHDGQI